MPILYLFYVKMPIRNLYFSYIGVTPPPPLNNLKKNCITCREGHPLVSLWEWSFLNLRKYRRGPGMEMRCFSLFFKLQLPSNSTYTTYPHHWYQLHFWWKCFWYRESFFQILTYAYTQNCQPQDWQLVGNIMLSPITLLVIVFIR